MRAIWGIATIDCQCQEKKKKSNTTLRFATWVNDAVMMLFSEMRNIGGDDIWGIR